ncbi:MULTISPECIES: hypothetical protein [unclassified Sphingomonas]|uniref:hypothetical protein n=1 Tax=unclassified Sphingomonas TaxID=196159 RepID=UPI0025F579AB|nr:MULTISPECIES: hypothetical protein [unclassified Sphingomonas]
MPVRTLIIAALALAPTALAAQTAPAPAASAKEAPPPLIIPPPSAKEVALPGAPHLSRQSVSTAVSRNAPVNGVLTLYGNERCPTNKEGEEVVVCVRRSAEEQFRIPKELRNFEVTPENAAWAVREKGNADVGAVGVGSCSTVGAAGATGCFVQQATRAKAEAKAREKEANPDLPKY